MNYLPTNQDLNILIPFLILGIGGVLLLVFPFLWKIQTRIVMQIITGILILMTFYTLYSVHNTYAQGNQFLNQIQIQPITLWIAGILLSVVFFAVISSPSDLELNQSYHHEYFSLVLFATLGMLFMIYGNDWVLVFVGLELMSLSLYILIGFARTNVYALESALKYFLLGSFTSAFMLLGIAFLFGGSSTTNIDQGINALSLGGYQSNFAKIGLFLFFIGVAFKLALFPFHNWTPDVYEGATTTQTSFLSSAPKAASMGMLLLLFKRIPVNDGGVFTEVLVILAILSVFFGNLAALRQTNIKRILAYSSLSHAGFVVGAIAARAYSEAIFYIFVYAFTSFIAFELIALLERGKLKLEISSISLLAKEKPLYAFLLSIVFLSLAGFPPLAGFWAKLFLFQKWASISTNFFSFLLWVSVIQSVVAFVYYIQIGIEAYTNKMEGEANREDSHLSWGRGFSFILCFFFLIVGWTVFHPMPGF